MSPSAPNLHQSTVPPLGIFLTALGFVTTEKFGHFLLQNVLNEDLDLGANPGFKFRKNDCVCF